MPPTTHVDFELGRGHGCAPPSRWQGECNHDRFIADRNISGQDDLTLSNTPTFYSWSNNGRL